MVALGAAPPATPAVAAMTGTIRGTVVADATGRPIPGATVTLPDLGIGVRAGPDGAFAFPQPIPTRSPYSRARVVVTAPGYGAWTLRGAPLYPNDTLQVEAALTPAPVNHTVLTPDERAARTTVAQMRAMQSVATLGITGHTCTGWSVPGVPPPTISVYLSARKVARRYSFRFYLQHVLPDEWYASWDPDALAAGAVAARTYAAYRAMPGNAYSEGSGCADVIDNQWDQVFDPTWSTASTDWAVDYTFSSALLRGRGLFLAQYWSGAPNDPCQAVTSGPFAGRMSQWGTQTCAKNGMAWPRIVTTFYPGTTWTQLGNLLLNPSFDAMPMYPWQVTSGSGRHVWGSSAYDGHWNEFLAPPPGRWATLVQSVPVVAPTGAGYGESVALRCDNWYPHPCSVEVRLVAVPASGAPSTMVRRATVPRDGRWHTYSWTPPAFTTGHSVVQFVVASPQAISVDRAVLTTPYP